MPREPNFQFGFVFVGLIHAAFLTPPPCHGQCYAITDLGTLGGTGSIPFGAGSIAYSINDAGQVVGEAATAGGDTHAFLWLPAPAYGLPAGMNDLHWPLDAETSFARDINNHGYVVGNSDSVGSKPVGFIWLPSPALGLSRGWNVFDDLADLKFNSVEPAIINNEGAILSERWWSDTHSLFLWLPKPMYGLPSGTHIIAEPIYLEDYHIGGFNDFGQVVWTQHNTHTLPDSYFGSVWFPEAAFGLEAGYQSLEATNPWNNRAWDINNLGQVVGRDGDAGFVWLPQAANGLPAGLNYLGTVGSELVGPAKAINDAMVIVGGSPYGGGVPFFLWKEGTAFNLTEMLRPPVTWSVMIPTDINNAGWIVGRGTNPDGETNAFLLTPTCADFDLLRDGDIGVLELLVFEDCFLGPENPVAVTCRDVDVDCDRDVDLRDFSVLQRTYTGSR